VFVSSGESVVLKLAFKFPGCTADSPKVPVLDCGSKDVVDLLGDVSAVGEERGSGRSSREKIDKSSLFHRSPSWCLFYLP
jgi:hypothetical protein